jgi:PD-(D/E)XK nuclease superfamily
MIEGWQPKEESIHLRFGIEYHKGLQNYKKLIADGLSHDDALVEVVHEMLYSTEDWDPDITTKAGYYKNRRSLFRSVIWYLDNHRDDVAETHILNNGKPAVEMSFRYELDYGPKGWDQPYVLCGHLDEVVNYNDELFVQDHKTTTSSPNEKYFSQYEPNNQMSFYSLASRVVLHDSLPIKGVIINVAYLTVDATQYYRGFTFRSSDQLDEWERDLKSWLHKAEEHAIGNDWPQNDTACDKYGGCRFREVCSQSLKVREQFLKADFVKVPLEERWNPLKPR